MRKNRWTFSIILATSFMLVGAALVLTSPYIYEEPVAAEEESFLSWEPAPIVDKKRAIRNAVLGIGLFVLGVAVAFVEPTRDRYIHLMDQVKLPSEEVPHEEK